MELRYVGPHDEVEVELESGRPVRVPFNGKLEVTGAVAEELLKRPDWHRWADPGKDK